MTSSISRSASRRRSPSRATLSSLYRSRSNRKSTDSNCHPAPSLSRNASRRTNATPIMYSNSMGMVMPPAVEKNLQCTLEELCFGCTKKINITRDAVTNSGQLVQEEQFRSIKVKPGWKKGTKITLEGMGNEVPGGQPADMLFVIAEKHHHRFGRDGTDDLELLAEIPLVEALTGCTISVPLLGGGEMELSMDDEEIIHLGHEKIIEEHGKRGNLKLTFSPKELTEEHRSNSVSILEECC